MVRSSLHPSPAREHRAISVYVLSILNRDFMKWVWGCDAQTMLEA